MGKKGATPPSSSSSSSSSGEEMTSTSHSTTSQDASSSRDGALNDSHCEHEKYKGKSFVDRHAGLFILLVQALFVSLLCGLGHYTGGAAGGDSADTEAAALTYAARLPVYMDVTVMIFIGFGFLMVFLARYGYSSVGMTFLLAAVCIEAFLLFSAFWHGPFEEWDWVQVDLDHLLRGDFAAGAVLISFGFLLGTVSPVQMLFIALIEVFFFALNEEIGLKLTAADAGGSMTIHMFGAYFGFAASLALKVTRDKCEHSHEHEANHATRTSDLMAMIGTLFLWVFWPTFNSGIAGSLVQERAATNTVLSLVGSCVMAFGLSQAIRGKFNMAHIQNATLAGGVAVGATADMMLTPGVALLIGSLAGLVSCAGFIYATPLLEDKIGLHDTCGAHNLHGMPSLIAGVASVIAAAVATEDAYGEKAFAQVFSEVAGDHRTAGQQGLIQLAYIGTTLGISLLAGFGSGLVANLLSYDHGMFRDDKHWELEEDDVENAKEK